MRVTEFIGQHIDAANIDVPKVPCDTICKMCGKQISEGYPAKRYITSTWTDYAYLKHASDYFCRHCTSCIGKIHNPNTGKKTFFRNFSFCCTESALRLLKREDLLGLILSPPDTPFILCVTYSNKKHISFKSGIQTDKNHYAISTDIGDVQIDRKEAEEIIAVIQKWYSVIPEKVETKQQPTWFTKSEIMMGCHNYNRIQDYGIQEYFEENEIIAQWRGSQRLKLLVFCLNKALP